MGQGYRWYGVVDCVLNSFAGHYRGALRLSRRFVHGQKQDLQITFDLCNPPSNNTNRPPPTAVQAGEWIIVEVTNRSITAWFGRGDGGESNSALKHRLVVLLAA
jgi:hypothetical protein